MSISSRPFYNMWVISYFSVVLLRGPSDKMLLFLWCTKINVVSFWVPLILLTRPFLLIWLSHISVQFYLGDLLKKCYYSCGVQILMQGTFRSIQQTLLQYMGISYFSVVSLRGPSDKMLLFMWCAKINVVSFRAPFLLLTRPFFNIWVSHISVQFHLGPLLTKCFYSCGVQKSMQFRSGYLSFD